MSEPVTQRQLQRVTQRLRPAKPEVKYITSGPTTWNFDTTGTVTVVNSISMSTFATDVDSRVGRQIRNVHAHIRGIINPADASSGPTRCSLYLIRDRLPNGGTFSVNQFLDTVTSTSMRNLANLKRFIILWEHHTAISQVDNTATQSFGSGPSVESIEQHIPLNFVTQFSGVTASGAAGITSDGIFLLSVGNQLTAQGAIFNASVRIHYVDA